MGGRLAVTLTAKMLTVALAIFQAAVVLGSSAYQPNYRQPIDQSALNFQRQILQWQQSAAQRIPYSAYSQPWASRGYGQYRQEATQGALPPQPTVVDPVPLDPVSGPGQLDNIAPLQEVNNNQVGGEVTTLPPAVSGPVSQDPLRALCKAPRGQFAGTSCSRFVNCWDDVVFEQECPFGLSFNEKAGYCDFAWNVPCNSAPVYQPDAVDGPSGPGEQGPGVQGPGQAPEQDLGAPGARCPTEFGTYRSNQNCGVFYMCVGYQPFEFVCPGGLNFHKDLQVCDYPYRVECNGVPSNQLPPEPTLVPEGETTALAPPGEPAPPAPPAPFVPQEPSSELPPSPPAIFAPEPPTVVAPTSSDAYYHLRKVPSSLVNSGVACRPNTVYRLTPSCQSVAVCRDGLTQVLNCGAGTSYDVYSDRCVPFLRARC